MRKSIFKTRIPLARFLLFNTIAIIISCSQDECNPTACLTLTPTPEDIGITNMYKSGSTHRFLLNSKDTLSFIASDVKYYEGLKDFRNQKEGCFYHYVSHIFAKVRLSGINNSRHMEFIISTWRRTGNSKNMNIREACALTLDKDSMSNFKIVIENPLQNSVDAYTDSIFFSKNTLANFNVLNRTYNDVYYVNNKSITTYFGFYYHNQFGLLKFTTSAGETLELIQ